MTMTRLALVLAALGLVGAVALAQQPVAVTNIGYDPCGDPAKVQVFDLDLSAATTSTTVAAISGVTRVYLCSAKIQGGAAGSAYLAFGAGSDCGTSTEFLDIMVFTAANTPPAIVAPGGGNSTFYRSQVSHALCFGRIASMTAVGHVRFVQE